MLVRQVYGMGATDHSPKHGNYGVGRTAHSPHARGRWGNYGMGRTAHSPKHGNYGVGATDHSPKHGNYGVGATDHSPKHGNYGVGGWADIWQDVVKDVTSTGLEIVRDRYLPDQGDGLPGTPPIVVMPQQQPQGMSTGTMVLLGALAVGAVVLLSGRRRS